MYVEKINKVWPHILALINCKLRYSTGYRPLIRLLGHLYP